MYNFDEIIDRTRSNSVKYGMMQHYFGTSDAIPLWVADMDFRCPDVVIEAIRHRLEHGILGYSFRPPSFAESVCQWFERRHRWKPDPSWVSFSPGIVPALNLAVLAFTDPGDEIVVQPPVYFPFFSAVSKHNRKLIYNQLNHSGGIYRMDLDNLASSITKNTRMLILCNPHNPVGRCWTRDELLQLASICLENNILVISDEIHCDLTFPPNQHTVFSSLSGEIAEQTITLAAPSKTFNLASMATAVVIASNPVLKKKFDDLIGSLHVDLGNVLGATALEAAYTYGDAWLDALLDYLHQNHLFVLDYVREHLPCMHSFPLEATYLLWIDCRPMNFTSNEELNHFMLHKAKVAMSPGHSFGPGGEGFMRMNLACPQKLLHEALNRIQRAWNEYTKTL